MLYTFGDSFTYGKNHVGDTLLEDRPIEKEEKRKSVIWPTLLAKTLNVNVKDFSYPAGSNWRIARQVQSIKYNKDDFVVVSWTTPSRFEFGVNESYEIKPNTSFRLADYIENDNGVITRRFYQHLDERTKDKKAKILTEILYNEYYNEKWLCEMSKIMFHSTVNYLRQSNCKWLMFNTWCPIYFEDLVDYDWLESLHIKEYLLGPQNNMSDCLREEILTILKENNNKEEYQQVQMQYWTDDEHIQISDYLKKSFEEIYE
jgi:hypothetical protein